MQYTKKVTILTKNMFTLFLFCLIALITIILYLRSRKRSTKPSKYAVTAVLGSGGHTREMLGLLGSLSPSRYGPLTLVVADTDALSVRKAAEVFPEAKVVMVPRSREVLQSWISTVWTTFKASLLSYRLLLQDRSDLLLCNGPGTCVPLMLGAWFNNLFGLSRTRLLYVESICRVQSLSLSGKILQYFVHDLLVQWPELAEKYPRTKYVARF